MQSDLALPRLQRWNDIYGSSAGFWKVVDYPPLALFSLDPAGKKDWMIGTHGEHQDVPEPVGRTHWLYKHHLIGQKFPTRNMALQALALALYREKYSH